MNPPKPLLLVDVDGVISLFGFDAAQPPAGSWHSFDGIAHLLSATAGPHLRALHAEFDPVWCTGWEERANEHLPWALALDGPLPHLSFDRAVGRGNAHWKLDAIERYAGPDRPLAWIDDAFDDSCERWAATRAGPTLLLATRPAIGLTDAHVAELLAWAGGLRTADGR